MRLTKGMFCMSETIREWLDKAEARSGDYYYLRVIQRDGHMAWSSPIWVDVGEMQAS